MKKIIVISLMALLVVGCGSNKILSGKITCDQKEKLMSNDSIVLIDVRTNDEYRNGHLDKAINIPYDVIDSEIKKYKDIDENSTIIVYCKSGQRSGKAYETLKNMGYKNIYDLGPISSCDK